MTRLVDRIAAALAQRAVQPGDRVVAQVEKSPEAIALYLACLRLGAVFVPLNTAYTTAEIEYFLGDADPKIAVGVAERRCARWRTLAQQLNPQPVRARLPRHEAIRSRSAALHVRDDRPLQGRDADARESRVECA